MHKMPINSHFGASSILVILNEKKATINLKNKDHLMDIQCNGLKAFYLS